MSEQVSPVLAERRGAALLVTIARPEAGNSVNLAVVQGLHEAVRAARSDSACRALILTGHGEKFFCTGGDIKDYAGFTTKEQALEPVRGMHALMAELEALPIPVIAAINGYALGGGLELALACDFRIAAPNASLGLPQVKLGIIPGWGGGMRLVRDLGLPLALDLIMSGRRISAAEAHQLRLVQRIADGKPVTDAALQWAEEFAQGAPLALAGAKAVLRYSAGSRPEDALAYADDWFVRLWFSGDHKEAEQAFAQKRPPVFKDN